jgi:hypothetical protein
MGQDLANCVLPKPDPTRIQQLAVTAVVPLRHVKTSNPCFHPSPP